MMNPHCTTCGQILELEDPVDLAWMFYPGSPEIHRLFAIARMKIRRIWSCSGCGHFELASYPPS